MAVGVPCVAFECHEGLRDLIENGANGYLVSYANIELMAESACKLLKDEKLRRSFSEKLN